MKRGWHGESNRHRLARLGVKTANVTKQEVINKVANMNNYITDEHVVNKALWDGKTDHASMYAYARRKGASDDEAIEYAIYGTLPKRIKDTDGDGVPDRLDCDPNDPDKQGFFDVLKARVMQTRAVEGLKGADHDLRVANLRKEIEKREEELEAKKEAKLIKLNKETERKLYAEQLKEKERELDLIQDELEADTFKGRFKRGLRVIGSQAKIYAKKGATRVGQELFSDKPTNTYQKVSLTKQEKDMTSSQRIEAIRKKKKELAIIQSKKKVSDLTDKEQKLKEKIKLLEEHKKVKSQ